MSDPRPPQLELQIDSVAFGGKGIARLNGKVFFVPNSVPGDSVKAVVVEDSGRYATAKIDSWTERSSLRQTSNCQYSDLCGGCDWQEIPYKTQLEWKRSFIESAFARISKIATPINIDMHGSSLEHSYRNRILLKARVSTTGNLTFGYFQRSSRDFVSVSKCDIATNRINQFLTELIKKRLPKLPNQEVKFRFEIQDLPLYQEAEGHLALSVYDPDSKSLRAEDIIQYFSSFPQVKHCIHVHNQSDAMALNFDSQNGLNYLTLSGIFQQVNVAQNHVLRDYLNKLILPLNPKRILDIFCGSGNLSLQFAHKGIFVKGIEFSKKAITMAKLNLEKNNIEASEYHSFDAEKFLLREIKERQSYDVIIADPPREGMLKCLDSIVKINAKHIVYVSCDPTTLARDVAHLLKSNYEIVSVAGFDFFPQTYHIETVVCLRLKNA